MFDSISEFIEGIFVKFSIVLPENPFNIETYLDPIQSFMAKVNFFIPFSELATIFNLWVIAIFAAFGIFLLIKWIKNLIGK